MMECDSEYSNIPSFQYSNIPSSFSFQHDFILPAHFLETHGDAFGNGSRNVFANKVCFDWQFAMAAVNQDCKLNALRPAKIVQGVHGRSNSAPAEKHVINEHDRFSRHIKRNHGWLNI